MFKGTPKAYETIKYAEAVVTAVIND